MLAFRCQTHLCVRLSTINMEKLGQLKRPHFQVSSLRFIRYQPQAGDRLNEMRHLAKSSRLCCKYVLPHICRLLISRIACRRFIIIASRSFRASISSVLSHLVQHPNELMVQKRKAGAWRYKQGSELQKELKLGDISRNTINRYANQTINFPNERTHIVR